jgi:hypothetical protein
MIKAARLVTLRHPNSIDCMVYQKKITRHDSEPDTGMAGGLPTQGGLGVLVSDDEADIDYVKIGMGKLLFTGQFAGGELPSDSAVLNADAAQLEAQIELIEPGYVIHKGDMIGLMPGAGIVIGYEVMDLLGPVNIPPYITKFRLAQHDALHHLVPWRE